MKISTLSLLGYSLVFTVTAASGQLKKQCETCFASSITKAVKNGDHCTDYTIEVTYVGRCEHALSHFTVAVPSCATVSHLRNSENWAQVKGYDPTTGLTGFKIDNTSNFCENYSKKKFTVSFTLCNNTSCLPTNCWKPTVAYKAGNCFELDTLRAPCANLTAHLEKKDASCFGVADGTLTVIVDQGQAPYQYTWTNGSTSSSLQHLGSGSYSVAVQDASGAQVSLTGSIVQPDAITASGTITDAGCGGESNGAIALTIAGGHGEPYSYLWSNSATTRDIDSLKAGTYQVTVKDSAGCTTQAIFTIKNLIQINLSASIQPPGCNQNNGAIAIAPSGGTAPYSFLWSNGSTQPSLTELPPGTYSVTVSDANGCSTSASYLLRENKTLVVGYQVTPTTCLENAGGAIDLLVTGGTPPYSYSWSNGSTTQDISGLTTGFYTVTVTDSLGCKTTVRISVFKNTFQVSSQIVQPNCFGEAGGAISITPSGGVSPYHFEWSNGSTSSSLDHLLAGTYSVTITDSTGCSRLMVYTIDSPPELKVASVVASSSCTQNGIDLTVTGGTLPYHYLWSTGAVEQDLSGVPPGTYSVVVTDAHGCTQTHSATIDSVPTWSCLINAPTIVPVCLSHNNLLTASISDAESYQWQVTSSDGSWAIAEGALTDSLFFTAGNATTSATFTLTLIKNGCTQSCTYTASACTEQSGGPGDEDCNDCFRSSITEVSHHNDCTSYSVKVATDGNCRHELSHFVIAIPCGEISKLSDSEGWPIVVGKDPTTGLTGIKVDNVNNFGKHKDSFTLTFTVCASAECGKLFEDWSPVVAYKAGQCVAYDTLNTHHGISSCAYPNPFHGTINFEVTCDRDDDVVIEICDQYGRKVTESSATRCFRGEKKTIAVDGNELKESLYFYRIRSNGKAVYGKLLKGK